MRPFNHKVVLLTFEGDIDCYWLMVSAVAIQTKCNCLRLNYRACGAPNKTSRFASPADVTIDESYRIVFVAMNFFGL